VSLVDEVKADLLWHLEFEDNILDTAGHASGPYNATIVGAGIEGYVDGRVGRAVDLNGSATRIDVPGLPSPLTEWTFSAWVKSDVPWFDEVRTIAAIPGWNGGDGDFVCRSVVDQDLWINCGNIALWVPNDTFIEPDDLNRWIHLAITWTSATPEAKLYIDGVLADTRVPAGGTDINWDLGASIGAWNYSAGLPFNAPFLGAVDDVRFYDEALDAGAIADLALVRFPDDPNKLAGEPYPNDGAVNTATTVTLSWTAGDSIQDVNGHEVYFGTHEYDIFIADKLSPEYQGAQDSDDTTFNPGTLQHGETYYWRIDEVNEPNTWVGYVWEFTVGQEIASQPNPTDGAEDVNVSATILSWSPGLYAASHNVYFGTDFNEVNDTMPNSLYAGDVDEDGSVDYNDVWVVAQQWLTDPGVSVPSADLDDSGNVDFNDYAVVANDWKKPVVYSVYRGKQALDANTYDPGTLESSVTYYWRIDEVNEPNTWKGDVWSFTTNVVLKIDSNQPTRLTGQTAVKLTGAVEFPRPLSLWLEWSGSGSVTWQVEVEESGEYGVALSYASANSGAPLTVTSDGSVVSGTTQTTQGLYSGWSSKYERILLEDTLQLSEGFNDITLTMTNASYMHLHSLELIPSSALPGIVANLNKARQARANTDWFVAAKYGVMFHWTSRTQPRHGPQQPYLDAVDAFDVNSFAEMVEQTGASYVIFTVNHGDHTCPMPLESWESFYPGSTSERDLVGDMADALSEYGIKLLLYLSPSTIGKESTDLAFWHEPSWPFLPDFSSESEDFFDLHEEIFTEIGLRYEEKVAGYWLDAYMGIYLKYPHYPYERMNDAFKAGDPNRLVSLNTWVLPLCTAWQDYWSGEGINPSQAAISSRYLDDNQGAGLLMNYSTEILEGTGLQSHVLFILDDNWVHTEANTPISPPIHTDEQLIAFVQQSIANQCVVTMNLGIYQKEDEVEGWVGQATLDQLIALRLAIYGE